MSDAPDVEQVLFGPSGVVEGARPGLIVVDMDEEIVRINGQRVRPVVREVYIGLRGSPTRPYITFIGDFPAPLREGENIYENYYEAETAEYDYEAVWVLPQGAEIVEWWFAGQVETPEPNILRVYVTKGTNVGGREGFKFRMQRL